MRQRDNTRLPLIILVSARAPIPQDPQAQCNRSSFCFTVRLTILTNYILSLNPSWQLDHYSTQNNATQLSTQHKVPSK